MVGSFAISKSGHDKGQTYVIVNVQEENVFLSDGRLKPIEKPKKKNVKHIQIIKAIPEDLRNACYQNGAFWNEGIKKALKEYGQRQQPTRNQED